MHISLEVSFMEDFSDSLFVVTIQLNSFH